VIELHNNFPQVCYSQPMSTVIGRMARLHPRYSTDAMGWIISRVTGMFIPELLSERIRKPLGTYFDGYYRIDGAGIAFAGGGVKEHFMWRFWFNPELEIQYF